MKSRQIEVGKTYVNSGKGCTLRTVKAIGPEYLPKQCMNGDGKFPNGAVGVLYSQQGPGKYTASDQLLWIDSFARWAKEESSEIRNATAVDITGQRCGSLIAVEPTEKRQGSSVIWRCKCEACGREDFLIPVGRFRKGKQKSCGCLTGQSISQTKKVHGMTYSPTWMSWNAMHQRCSLNRAVLFKNHSAKGISVCDEWSDFMKFYNDMGERPAGMTLDRIDNEKGYFKENCRWATRYQQIINRSCTVYVEIFGINMPRAFWLGLTGTDISTFEQRRERGWSAALAAFSPPKEKKYLIPEKLNWIFL